MNGHRWDDWLGGRQRWIDAQRFKMRVRRLLAPEKVSFTQWLVLEAIVELEHPEQLAVSQVLIAERLNISERVTSYTVDALAERGLVERDAEDCPFFWNLQLTRRGEELRRRCRRRLDRCASGFGEAA